MKVLVVDDSPDDFFLTSRSFRGMKNLTITGRAANGEEAIAYLSGTGEYADRTRFPFPDLLLLDLRMPLVDGFEVLTWLRDQNFPGLRVAVLSGSNRKADIDKALELGAHFYYVKDPDPGQLQRSLRAMVQDFFGEKESDSAAMLQSA